MELTLDQALKNGIEAHKAGKLQEADRYYTSILIAQPKHPDANHNMGVLAVGVDKIQEALPFFKKALETNPGIDQFWLSYINALIKLNLVADAKAVLDEAKSKDVKGDGFAETYNNMGKSLKDQGKLEEAKESYKKAFSIKPDYAEAYCNMGIALQKQGKLEEAIESYKKSFSIKPNYAQAYYNMGIALQKQSNLEKAIEAYNKALLLNPNYAQAYYNIGSALQDQGKLDKAIESYNKALSLKPDYAQAHNNIGIVLNNQGKLEEAIRAYNKALSIKPDYVEAHNNMGKVLQESGATKEAIQAYKKSILFRSDFAKAHKNLSFALLSYGSYQEGLDEYEWRWKTDEFLTTYRHFSQPLWKKETSLNGKTILVWCEQGVGDTITWSSCISHIASKAKYCILECQEKLVPLLERSFPNIEVKAEDRNLDTERNDFDFHLPMGSLYKNLSTEIFQKTKVDAYLTPDSDRVDYWNKRLKTLGNGPFIGINWKSILMSPGRLPNYAPISEWYALLRLPNIKFINLQPKDFEEDLNKIKNELGVTVYNFDDLDHINDVDDVAALYSALDMVLSTQSFVPLISAAVGTSTKLASWRQSPWNNILHKPVGPLVDKFERDTWEPWENVFNLISEDIVKLKIEGSG